MFECKQFMNKTMQEERETEQGNTFYKNHGIKMFLKQISPIEF